MAITLRLRTKDGTERVQVEPEIALPALLDIIAEQLKLDRQEISVTRDGPGREHLPHAGPLGAKHGDMLFLHYHAEREAIARYEEKDQFKRLATEGELRKQGVKEWTLTSFLDYRSQREYKLVNLPDPRCLYVSVDPNASNNFLANMQAVNFACQRVGLLYGRFTADGGVQVDAIYEPAQECTDASIQLSEDPFASRAHVLAGHLGLELVGWIFAHPPRANAFAINEVILGARLQQRALEAARAAAKPAEGSAAAAGAAGTEKGAGDAPAELPAQRFVTLKARLVMEGEAIEGVATVEAYQMSDQCLALVQADAFKQSATDARCAKTVKSDCFFVIEQKESRKATAEHFVARVHDMSRPYTSPLRTSFPGAPRAARARGGSPRDDCALCACGCVMAPFALAAAAPATLAPIARAAASRLTLVASPSPSSPARRALRHSGESPDAAADTAVPARVPAAPARRALRARARRLAPAHLRLKYARHEHRHAHPLPGCRGRRQLAARGLPDDAQRLCRDRMIWAERGAPDDGKRETCRVGCKRACGRVDCWQAMVAAQADSQTLTLGRINDDRRAGQRRRLRLCQI